ncbi:TIGR03435 family protein [Granulicella mallensis]|nr:TIGR03435 family protein [Granulicella mallensis]
MIFAVLTAFAQVDASKAAPASEGYVPTLTFDVASIRQSPEANSYTVTGGFQPHSSSIRIVNFDAMNLLSMAYDVRWDQIVGMPNWHAMFNIQAKSDSAADERLAKLSKAQEKLEQQHMMQVLLADRFKLKTHWETREGPTYNLVVAKNGPKMSATKGKPPNPEQIKEWGGRPIPPLYQQGDSDLGFDFIANGCAIKDITNMLAGQFGHPVTDKTGLTGKYDFILRYHGARLSDRDAGDMDPLPTLDVAIQDQLGLKLEPSKGSVQFLVIDHIEKPSEN